MPEFLTVEDNPNATHWNIEDGYHSNANASKSYPRRLFGVGLSDVITIKLHSVLDDFYKFCAPSAQGFKVAFHSPDQFPRLPSEFIHIPFNQFLFVSIKPNMITTSDGLRSYSPNKKLSKQNVNSDFLNRIANDIVNWNV